jgi:serine/threonine-protein kinase
MAQSSADRNPVERLAEEFLQRHRRGEHPSVSEYVDRYPEGADEIRGLFPALVMMERLKPAPADVTGSFIGDARSQPSRVPERLGDFRILREVGRGGMGIVFEAEQESLGRHVALKVLPAHALLNPRHLQRFLREARSAARLHHTNIVPVFGVGEGDGLHYYVMQFIAGSGLHEVIAELRRLKSAGRPTAEVCTSPVPTRSVREVAQGLLTGRFGATPGDVTTDAGLSHGQPAAGPPASVTRDFPAHSAILSGSGRNFAKAVARVGLQVAQSLAYAHGQGVLHRDIKPSNLLLDVQGAVWVTDFGLAKAMADTDGLTQEGDVLGTLRYMAPERFRGQSDARSDLYALGLTLYELLTLRPAFDQEDRDRLIHQVTTDVPPRPRALNPEIPRDLETIILKATEHDPARRYQDAEELADELERFLADRPIKARPVGALERAWKWSQRKPAIAGLLAALALAVVVGFAGITWQWREAVTASRVAHLNEKKAQTNFRHALETVDTFCTQVSEEHLLDQPGMQPLRRRLLELALRYYQRFQREQGDDPSLLKNRGDDAGLMKDLALTFRRSGIINSELGESTAAQSALLRAKDLLEELCRADPKDVNLRVELVRCYIELEEADRLNESGILRSFSGRGKLTSLMESVVAVDSENPEYIALLGRSYGINGIREIRQGRYSASVDSLRKAVATLEQVGQTAPDNAEVARWRALAYADLGLVYQLTGHQAECVRALGKAQAIFQALEGRLAKSRRYRLDHAECLVSLGNARADLGQYHEAATCLHEAGDRLADLSRQDKEAVDLRYWLALAKQGSGRVALARGQIAVAGSLLREAGTLYERVPAASLSERDLLALARSYLWLGRVELQAGHREAILPLHGRLINTLETFKGQLFLGSPLAQQSRDLAELEGLIEPLFASASARSAPERIAAQLLELKARENLASKQRDNPALRFEAAWSLVRLAEFQVQDGRTAEARSSLDRAVPVLKDVTKAEPENLRWRQGLARACEALGRVQARSDRSAEARDATNQAVEIAEELARLDPAYAYDLACTLSLLSRVCASEADAVKAIAALRRAIQAGFDNDDLLRTDPRLDGLRSRPDFPAPRGKTA